MSNNDSMSPDDPNGGDSGMGDSNSNKPETSDTLKPKRIACVICRKRKLRCDGIKPSCGTCSRLGHSCAYDEVRRKSGPKRGYVKALEARLAQVETLLKGEGGEDAAQGGASSQASQQPALPTSFEQAQQPVSLPEDQSGAYTFNAHRPANGMNISQTVFPTLADRQRVGASLESQIAAMHDTQGIVTPEANNSINWDMIGLGVEEPLPPPEVQDHLFELYFQKCYQTIPIVHKARFMASLNLAPAARPPVALRYIMWALAAALSDKYSEFQYHFYTRSRKYLEELEMRNFGENIVNLQVVQTWALIAGYEFCMMYFPRAWLSVGRAQRLSQMCGLHRLDEPGLDVKVTLPPPRDWSEREERSRTFWHIFCMDRYASIGTGWPMSIDERDIRTHLPGSERAFEQSIQEPTISLNEAMSPQGAKNISSFGAIMLTSSCFGRNLHHLHRSEPGDRDDDINGAFWKRHRQMDSMLLNISLSLPPHLRLPSNISDQKVVFTNFCIHTVTICLHQAAIFKAESNNLPSSISVESKIRCVTAAQEIANIMKMISHVELTALHPYIPFTLYVAARVFIQYLKTRPDDEQALGSLQFLITAMNVIKTKNAITESFLIQLDVDMDGKLETFSCAYKPSMSNAYAADMFNNKGTPVFPPFSSRGPSSTSDSYLSKDSSYVPSGDQNSFKFSDMENISMNRMEGLTSRSRPAPSPGLSDMDVSADAGSSSNGSHYPTPEGSGSSNGHSGGSNNPSPFAVLDSIMNSNSQDVSFINTPDGQRKLSDPRLPIDHVHDSIFSSTIPPSLKKSMPQADALPSKTQSAQINRGYLSGRGGANGGIVNDLGRIDFSDIDVDILLNQFSASGGNVGNGFSDHQQQQQQQQQQMNAGLSSLPDDMALFQEMVAMGWTGPNGMTGMTPLPTDDLTNFQSPGGN